MKKSRILVLFLAVAAAGGAFVLASGTKTPDPAPVAALPPPPAVVTDDVLVAAKEVPVGTLVSGPEFTWQPWPKEAVTAGMIRKSENPKIVDELKGSIARAGLLQGEPVRREKLIKGANGLMAAILPSGKRAVAINIDSQGATTAGGFILPNDRVDVIRTYREDTKGAANGANSEAFISETLLHNVRVLAIGQQVQEKNGQPVVVGSNATLELDPQQAETVVLGQRTGQLSLSLRSMLDAKQAGTVVVPSRSMSVVRYGTVTEDANR